MQSDEHESKAPIAAQGRAQLAESCVVLGAGMCGTYALFQISSCEQANDQLMRDALPAVHKQQELERQKGQQIQNLVVGASCVAESLRMLIAAAEWA